MADVLARLAGEVRSCDEYPLPRPLPYKRARKPLDFGPSDGSLPSLRLDINRVQPKPILFDDAVNTLIPAAPDCFSSILPRAAISHFHEQLDDQTLEEAGGTPHDPSEEF